MGKKKKPERDMLEEGFWQEFEDTLEHLRTRRAIVVISMDRLTGEVQIDGAMSSPAETWYMLSKGEQAQAEVLEPSVPDDD